jgi:CheY-like chemotaxis protein
MMVIPKTAPVVWILLASDDIDRRNACKAILERAGFGIELAGHGRVTIEKAKHRHYDLLLLDMALDVSDGLRAVAAIREMEWQRGQVETPMLAIIGAASNGAEEYCRTLGINRILKSPVATPVLVKLIEGLVSMRTPG